MQGLLQEYLDSSDSIEIAGMLANCPPNHEFQDQEVSEGLAVKPSAPDEPILNN